MIITTGFIGILLLSFNHLTGGYISSQSSGVSHVSSKGVAKGVISENKEGQDRKKIRIEPAAHVTGKEQPGFDKSHPHLADDHDRDGWDHHDDDGHDHERWDHDHDRHDDDGWDHDGENHDDRDHDNIWP